MKLLLLIKYCIFLLESFKVFLQIMGKQPIAWRLYLVCKGILTGLWANTGLLCLFIKFNNFSLFWIFHMATLMDYAWCLVTLIQILFFPFCKCFTWPKLMDYAQCLVTLIQVSFVFLNQIKKQSYWLIALKIR